MKKSEKLLPFSQRSNNNLPKELNFSFYSCSSNFVVIYVCFYLCKYVCLKKNCLFFSFLQNHVEKLLLFESLYVFFFIVFRIKKFKKNNKQQRAQNLKKNDKDIVNRKCYQIKGTLMAK